MRLLTYLISAVPRVPAATPAHRSPGPPAPLLLGAGDALGAEAFVEAPTTLLDGIG